MTSAPKHPSTLKFVAKTQKHAQSQSDRLNDSMAILHESIANGTHSATVLAVCGDCREWCDGHYYINAAGVGLCGKCADKIGQGPVSDSAKRNRATGAKR